MKLIVIIAALSSLSIHVSCQIECPTFGKRKSRSSLSNDSYLHYGVDVFTLIYADKPWIFSIVPHTGIYAEINLLRHLSIGGSIGSQFKLEFSTDLPVYKEPYGSNVYFKFESRVYLNKVYNGIWIAYAQTLDKELRGIKLIQIGYASKVSKLGIINYYAGMTFMKRDYFNPRFITIGISLGTLRKRSFLKL